MRAHLAPIVLEKIASEIYFGVCNLNLAWLAWYYYRYFLVVFVVEKVSIPGNYVISKTNHEFLSGRASGEFQT